jgi:hypothetical protein
VIVTTITSSALYWDASSSISARTFSGEPMIARRPEMPPFAVERGHLAAARVDEIRERIAQSQLAGPDRALRRGAQQPGHRQLGQPWQGGGQVTEGMVFRQVVIEVGQQLAQLLGEVVRGGLAAVALQRERGERIGAGGPADSQVDPPGVQGSQDRE